MRTSKVGQQASTARSSLCSSALKENAKLEQMQNIINQNCGGSISASNILCTETKINYLESNLNRVCLQQDALMPLLQIVELLPVVQKCDATLKSITKKVDEQENRQVKVERIVEQRLKEKCDKQPLQKLETAKISKTVETLNTQFKDLEHNFSNVHRWYEAKLKEESYQIQRNIEVKLEKQKTELKNQICSIKSSTSPVESMKASAIQVPHPDMVTKDELRTFKQELLQEMKGICFDRIENIRQDLNFEMRNIYKEIGGLRCEVEHIINLDRKNKITMRVQDELSEKELSQIEQQLKINILEQECFIQDLDSFNNENSTRIIQELNSIRDDCNNITKELETKREVDKQRIVKRQKEIEYLFERNVNLKYQLAGTKKKFANEMKKIEEKFIILDQIKLNLNVDEISPNIENDLYTIKSLEEKIDELMMNINGNLEQDLMRIQEVENELTQLKQNFMQIYN